MRIRFGTANITEKTKKLTAEALENGLISQGPWIKEFEETLAKWLGVKNVVATANGTLADAVALAAIRHLDLKRRKTVRNEVIVPALTFVAQINALYYNHLVPVFVDSGYDCQIDVSKIEEKISERTLAIMPVHLLGKPANMKKILELAKRYDLFVVEDACEAFGTTHFGKKMGTFSEVGCFSFFISHSITTGEGGAAVTNDDHIAEILRSLRNHGRKSEALLDKFNFPLIGFSAKMNSLEAIVGLGLMSEVDASVSKRRESMLYLNSLLKKSVLKEEEGEWIVPHGYPLLIESKEKRDALLTEIPERYGIETRPLFYSIPTQCKAYSFLGEKLGSYPVAEDIGNRGLFLPCHQNLSNAELDYMAAVLKQVLS